MYDRQHEYTYAICSLLIYDVIDVCEERLVYARFLYL